MNEHHWNDHRGVDDALRERLQVVLQTSLEIYASAKQRAISRSQRLQADLERKSREARDRLRAQHHADMPLMRQAWSRGWWKSVKDNPEEIAHVVEVAGSWARVGDPAGERTLQELSRKIKDEFGIGFDLSATDRGDLVEQLGTALAPTPKERDDLDVAKAFARANGEKPETAVKAELIRRELGDEEWWSRAPDEEIAAVAHQVHKWDQGPTKVSMLRWIREQAEQHLDPNELDLDALLEPPAPAPEPPEESGTEQETEQPAEPVREPTPDVPETAHPTDPDEAISSRDEAHKRALEDLNDPELTAHVTAAAMFGEGVTPSGRYFRYKQREGKRGSRSRTSQATAESELDR